jgi:hypothetical protein
MRPQRLWTGRFIIRRRQRRISCPLPSCHDPVLLDFVICILPVTAQGVARAAHEEWRQQLRLRADLGHLHTEVRVLGSGPFVLLQVRALVILVSIAALAGCASVQVAGNDTPI